MTNTQKPLDLIESTILTITQTQRALNESREQYIAQSILTPLPGGRMTLARSRHCCRWSRRAT